MDETDFMRRAVALARAQLGRTGANPAVGCVVVRDGRIVGEGATADGGRPHAEDLALRQAGALAQGGVAYVTLEPCGARSAGGVSCAQRLAESGVARVVVGCADPSMFAGGLGTERLRAAGIAIETGFLEAEVRNLYTHYRAAGA